MPKWLLRLLRLGRYELKENPMGELVPSWRDGPMLKEIKAEMQKRREQKAAAPVFKEVTMRMQVTRLDGTVQDYGVVGYYHQSRIRRWWENIKIKLNRRRIDAAARTRGN